MWIVWILMMLLYWQNGLSDETGSGFTCEGRASGYYADIDSGCQVYHMCDGLGRQFSYSCPNTTLFQQRMLICDHWYMVNCSRSELDYNANLLIGQKDKPFVDDSSEHPYHRTPRPDLETRPYAPRYQSDYRQGRSQFKTSQNLVGVVTKNENTTEPQYFPPSHWFTQYEKVTTTPLPGKKYKEEKLTSVKIDSKVIKSTKGITTLKSFKGVTPKLTVPTLVIKPTIPIKNVNINERFTNDQNFEVFSATTPRGIVSSLPFRKEDPSKVLQVPKIDSLLPPPIQFSKPTQSSFKPTVNTLKTIQSTDSQIANSFKSAQPTVVLSPSSKPTTKTITPPSSILVPPLVSNVPSSSRSLVTNEIEPPSRYYQPPKLTAYYESESTTMDPITFYKLVPSKELEPPIAKDKSNEKSTPTSITTLRSVTKKDTAKSETTPTKIDDRDDDADKKWRDLRQMFFIPEYDFPLDLGQRPGYDSGISSFQVREALLNPEARPADQSKDIKCDPKCDPSFLVPGTCKPCVMIRR